MVRLGGLYARSGIALLFLGVTLLIVANLVLYTHSHVTPQGQIITHAHPVSGACGGGDIPEHGHSAELLYQIQTLQLLAYSWLYAFHWAPICRVVYVELPQVVEWPSGACTVRLPARSPPLALH